MRLEVSQRIATFASINDKEEIQISVMMTISRIILV